MLASLSAEAYRAAADDLASYAGLGGSTCWSSGSPWVDAFRTGAITNAAQARAALDAANILATHTLPRAAATLRGLLSEVGLVEPVSVAPWASALELLQDVAATLAIFRPEVFSVDLRALAAALIPARLGIRRNLQPGPADRELGGPDRLRAAVVRLVTAGQTNRQVADQLFLSPNTIGSHPRHVFTKLGITSRVELVRLFLSRREEGPAPAAGPSHPGSHERVMHRPCAWPGRRRAAAR